MIRAAGSRQTEGAIRTAGVLGGLGPAATVDFMARVIARTDAATEQDHVRLIVDCNPKVPDRNAYAAGRGEGPDDVLAAMARGLEEAGADFLVMPCNSAHAHADAIRAAVAIPFIDMIDLVADAAAATGAGAALLLAADACLAAGLYQRALAERGMAVVLPDAAAQAALMVLIYAVKRDETGAEVHGAAAALVAAALGAAEAVVIGCTELPLLLAASDVALPLVSCTDLLAERTVVEAGALLRA